MGADLRRSRTDIERVVRQIVARFGPRMVVLFGSQAYGQPSADSDVDILVVIETDNPLHTAGLISAAVDHPFPIDVLVLTPSDLKEYRAEGASLAVGVVDRGEVLYEADDARVG